MNTKTKDCFAIFGVVTLASLLSLNAYIAYNLAIGRNVVLQKTVSVMPTYEEEQKEMREIVENKKYAKR